jgi:hypothetical protein
MGQGWVMRVFAAICLLSLSLSMAHAYQSSSIVWPGRSIFNERNFEDGDSNFSGDIGLESTELTKQPRSDYGAERFVVTHMKYSLKSNRHSLMAKMDATFREDLNASVPELFYQYTGNSSSIRVGRQFINYSPLDEVWELGIVNKRLNMDFYDNRPEGLCGASYIKNEGPFEFNFFASYLHIPQLRPSYKITDGVITSDSKWAWLPPTETSFENRPVYIRYRVEDPKIGDILFRPSIGGRISYTLKKTTVDAFYLIKPENQLRFSGDVAYSVEDDVAWADISGVGYQQRLFGANIVQRFGDNVFLGVSTLSVRPEGSSTNNEVLAKHVQISTARHEQDYLNVGLDVRKFNSKFSVNYLRQMSALRPSTSFINEQIKWYEAIGVKASTELFETILPSLHYSYDFETKTRMLEGELGARFGERLLGAVGMRMIEAPKDQFYWASFRANDYAYARLSYIF